MPVEPTRRHAVRLVTAALLGSVLGAGVAAAPDTCRLPRVTADEPKAASCGLEVLGALKVTETGGLGEVAVHEDLAAVVRRDDGIVTLVDLSDPTAPTALGSYDGGTGQASLDHPLDGDVAFSSDGTVLFHARQTSDASNEGLHVLDVSDPTAPTRVDLHLQGGMLRVAYADLTDQGGGELVATQDATHGLTIFEVVRTPAGARAVPVFLDALPALKVGGPASADVHFDLTGDRPLLYATDGTTGLRVLDVTDPAVPVELGTWADQGLAALEVEHRGDQTLLHVATEYWFDASTPAELITLDATDPSAISEVARVSLARDDNGELAWKLGGLRLHGGELYAAHGHLGMVALDPVDLSLRRATTDLGTPNGPNATYRDLAWFAMDVESFGDRLLVTDAVTGELRVLTPLG